MEWHYSKDGKQAGPVTEAHIREKIKAGELESSDLVWKAGFHEWQPAHSVFSEFSPPPLPDSVQPISRQLPEEPPPLPGEKHVATGDITTTAPELATRWPRFLARLFDIYLLSIPASFVAGFVLVQFFSKLGVWLTQPGASIWFGIFMLPFVLMLEALLYQWFGNSPGKALLGLKVANMRGEKLSLDQYMHRNLSLWLSGLAFGIPLVCLFTYANQGGRLERGLQTSYDEKLGTRVFGKPIGWFRKIVAAIAVLLLLLLHSALSRA